MDAAIHDSFSFSFGALAALFGAGGAVMAPLTAVGVVVWYLIVRRWQRLRPSLLGAAAAELGAAPYRHRAISTRYQQALAEGATLIRSLVRVAPLLGLLGTVAGMVQTFASLTGVQGVTADGSVAGGIGQALVTTQMGLFVAIPAVIAARLTERRAARLRGELLELVAVATAGGAGGAPSTETIQTSAGGTP